MDFLRFIDNKQNPSVFPGGMAGKEGAEPSGMEAMVYDMALTVILEYFNQPGFLSSPQIINKPYGDEDPPNSPALVAQ